MKDAQDIISTRSSIKGKATNGRFLMFLAALQAPLWLVVCAVLAVGHHRFYKLFSGLPAMPLTITIPSVRKVTFSQQWVVTIGNVFSALVHVLLPVSLRDASTQLFWRRVDALRQRPTAIPINTADTTADDPISVTQKDHIFATLMSPWSLNLINSPIRPYINLISTLAIVIPIFANPSLTIHLQQVNGTCPISTLDLAEFKLADISKTSANVDVGVTDVAVKTLISGSYLIPASPCGDCHYNTTFWGPALNCTPTDNATYPFSPDPDGQTVFWDSHPLAGRNPQLVVMSKPDSQTIPDIVLCSLLNGTYIVQVNHSIPASITATMQNFSPYTSPATATVTEGLPLDGLLTGLSLAIQGQISSNNTDDTFIQTSLIAYSSFGSFADGPWTLNGDLSELMEGLMRNFTLSLLAGSNSDARSIIQSVNSPCYYNALVYKYHPLRLWLTYGIALGISFILAATGFILRILCSNRPQTLAFGELVRNLWNKPGPQDAHPLPYSSAGTLAQ